MRGKKVKALRRAFLEEHGRPAKAAKHLVLARFRLVKKMGDEAHIGTMQVLRPAITSEMRSMKRGA